MSRVGLAHNSHLPRRATTGYGFGSVGVSRPPVVNLKTNLRNQLKVGNIARIQSKLAGAIWNIQQLSAGHRVEFAAVPAYAGLQSTYYPGLEKGIPTLLTNAIED